MAISPEATQILEGAEKLLGKRGAWIKGEYRNHDETKFCPYGACYKVAGENPYFFNVSNRALTQAKQALTSACMSRYGVGVPEFNDRPSTRKWQVLALLREARA